MANVGLKGLPAATLRWKKTGLEEHGLQFNVVDATASVKVLITETPPKVSGFL